MPEEGILSIDSEQSWQSSCGVEVHALSTLQRSASAPSLITITEQSFDRLTIHNTPRSENDPIYGILSVASAFICVGQVVALVIEPQSWDLSEYQPLPVENRPTVSAPDQSIAVHEEEGYEGGSLEDLLKSIDHALVTGDFFAARELSATGAERFPDHNEMQKFARVLAPPQVIANELPPNPSIRANRHWLKANRENYQGRCIALRNGQFLGDADSFDELTGQIGDTQGVLFTKIPRCS